MSENVTRRSVLEKGAFVSGATLLGGAAITGSSMAHEGDSSHASTDATKVMKGDVLTLDGSAPIVPCVAENDPVAGFTISAINGDPVSEKDIQFENTARFESGDKVKVVHTFGSCPEPEARRIGVNVVEA